MPKPLLPALQEMARLLGGEVVKGNVLCPGPGQSADDRSLSVTPSPKADCGFVVNSFAGDSVNVCKDYVREKLDLPPFEPKPKKRNGKGDGKLYSPTIAKYIYRTADGQPYLCVHRLADKKQGFPQYHWDGQLWKAGVPKGPKIPYRLPELIAAPPTTPVYIVEGEGKWLLKDFKVYPRNIKTGGKVLKGYVLSSFTEVFESYLSPLGGSPAVTALLSSSDNDSAGISAATARAKVAAQSPRNPLETNNSIVIAARDTLKDETKVKNVTCDYCHEPPDGTEQQAAYGTETLWLHPHCIDRFLEAQDDGLDIPECLRRY
jgi:hypothetical protein